MVDSDETEIKQNYLRTEILENDYDTSDFVVFLTYKYGEDAADINNYDFQTLQAIVVEFQSKYYKMSETNLEDRRKNPNENDIVEPIQQKTNSTVCDDIKNLKRGKTELYEDVVVGEKMVLSEIAFNEFRVKISHPEKNDGGFFSKSYITYRVTTTPFNFEVRRRYSDFEWLRQILYEQFPAFIIPPIPFKNFSDRFNDEFIDKRMRYLQQFISSIDYNKVLSSSMFYYEFISASEKDFEAKKKQFAKLKPPTKLTEMKSLDGSVIF